MGERHTMKRYLILILLILVLASLLISSCREHGALTEKQVIQMTYDYLIAKAEQLQGVYAEGEKIIIGWGFRNAVLEANEKAIEKDDLGELVEMELDEPVLGQPQPLKTVVWTGALMRLAKYSGDGLWSVTVSEWEWRVNERTGEVTAQNEEAVKLLEEITLKTYCNNEYSYCFDYPPSWVVINQSISGVLICSPDSKSNVLTEINDQHYTDLNEYVLAKVSWLKDFFHEVEINESTDIHDKGYTVKRIEYTCLAGGQRWDNRHYFVLYEGKVYEIVSSAVPTAFEEYHSLSPLYDPFDSFRFQP
ncbi:MAG: hypothetical protein HQ588_04675 [Deltaproteobacteria bacterium]|nr:hypothetical protein [Deltaproteobacteria bacterium]